MGCKRYLKGVWRSSSTLTNTACVLRHGQCPHKPPITNPSCYYFIKKKNQHTKPLIIQMLSYFWSGMQWQLLWVGHKHKNNPETERFHLRGSGAASPWRLYLTRVLHVGGSQARAGRRSLRVLTDLGKDTRAQPGSVETPRLIPQK